MNLKVRQKENKMKKLPKEYIIVEIIPSHSSSKKGFIVQLQALKVKEKQIIKRLDLRLREDLINNVDLLKMISYDKEMFTYTSNKDFILEEFSKFAGKSKILIIDNYYTEDYLSYLKNKKESVFNYLNMDYSDDVFDKIITKYRLQPSNHLVDLLFESLIFEDNNK